MKYSLSCDFGYDVTSPIPSVEPVHSNSHCLVPAVIGTKADRPSALKSGSDRPPKL